MARRNKELDGPTFQMREKLFAIGNDSWIEDNDGNKAFKVNGKAVRFRDTFILEDAYGVEVARIQEKKLSVRSKMTIERGSSKATVRKRLIGIRDRYLVDVKGGDDLKAKGNFVDHEYQIERGGKMVAEISKRWLRVRDTYGIQMAQDQDVALILAVTVCVDEMASD